MIAPPTFPAISIKATPTIGTLTPLNPKKMNVSTGDNLSPGN